MQWRLRWGLARGSYGLRDATETLGTNSSSWCRRFKVDPDGPTLSARVLIPRSEANPSLSAYVARVASLSFSNLMGSHLIHREPVAVS